jgi:hypothetical protein
MRANVKLDAAVPLMLAMLAAAPLQAATSPASQHEGRAMANQVAAITLRDVHPLYGGQILYLSADGSGYCQLVTHPAGGPSLYEKRYRVVLPPDKVAALWHLVSADALAAIPSSSQPGMPDAAKPRISARLSNGQVVSVTRWLHDKQADFDAVYQSLLAVTQGAAADDKLLMQGKFDPSWAPQGF